MSVRLSSYVWDGCANTGMKLTEIAVMARLADYSSDEGKCWPSIETIARQLGAGISTIRSAIGRLEADGQIFTSAGLCRFNQSFRAASIRVCQPLPVDLKASITSGEYLTVADFLVGSADTGLPRRITLLPLCRLALSKKTLSSSGASSGSTQVLFKLFNFAFIGFPHRDNTARIFALRPDHNNKPGIQCTYFDISDFPVVLSLIFGGKVDPCENLSGSGEIDTALEQYFFSLVLVIFNFHIIIVVTLNKKSNVDSSNSRRYTAMAAEKSAVGIGNPEFNRAHDRANAVFSCAALSHQTMVGRAGQPRGWPGSLLTGVSNPVRLTTHEIGNSGGELTNLSTEAFLMPVISSIFPQAKGEIL